MTAPVRWEAEAELAVRAVSTSVDLARERAQGLKVTTKGNPRDVVTELDLRIEAHIRSVLAPSGYPVLGEEGWTEGTGWEPGDQPAWVVDPIDGTANFVTGMPYFATSVGLHAGGRFVVGAVSIPAHKEIFFTHGDRGAFMNGKRLTVPSEPDLASSLVAASFSSAKGDPERRRRQYELFGAVNDASRGSLRLGSAATNVCFVAAGRLQAAYGVDAQAWDVGGALAIAEQANAVVVVSRRPGSTRLSYVVGCARAVAEIQALAARLSIPELGGAA